MIFDLTQPPISSKIGSRYNLSERYCVANRPIELYGKPKHSANSHSISVLSHQRGISLGEKLTCFPYPLHSIHKGEHRASKRSEVREIRNIR